MANILEPRWRSADDAQATVPGPGCCADLTIQVQRRQVCGRQRTPIRQWGQEKETRRGEAPR